MNRTVWNCWKSTALPPARPRPKGNAPNFDLKIHMHRLFGTDLTEIDGVSDLTAHVFFTEVGPGLSKFKTFGHFCSWLGLCPNNKISGGKILYVSYPARIEPSSSCPSALSQFFVEQQILPWRLLSTDACSTWGTKGNYSHCSQTGANHISSRQRTKIFRRNDW